MSITKLADRIAAELQAAITNFPAGFYDSFRFTQTGSNFAHPVTWGHLSQIAWQLPDVAHMAIDLRLNLGKDIKFQPDITALNPSFEPLLFIDYESPNSSDARIPSKDVDPYQAWREESNANTPYLIVTTLPNRRIDDWELRYTFRGSCNYAFRGRRAEVCQNPFLFWRAYYIAEFSKRDMQNIAMINVDGANVRRVYPAEAEP